MSKVGTRFHFHNHVVTRARPARITQALVAAAAVLLSQWASGQAAPRPEALIKWRQSAYQVIAWNSGRIKAALAGQYAPLEVQSAATTLAAVANAGLAALFAAGTADGKGWRETTVRDEVFSDAQKFRALTEEFARETNTLARLAAAGDRATVNEQFLKVAQACKTCHEKFRQTD
jgi:cytochrome c556